MLNCSKKAYKFIYNDHALKSNEDNKKAKLLTNSMKTCQDSNETLKMEI